MQPPKMLFQIAATRTRAQLVRETAAPAPTTPRDGRATHMPVSQVQTINAIVCGTVVQILLAALLLITTIGGILTIERSPIVATNTHAQPVLVTAAPTVTWRDPELSPTQDDLSSTNSSKTHEGGAQPTTRSSMTTSTGGRVGGAKPPSTQIDEGLSATGDLFSATGQIFEFDKISLVPVVDFKMGADRLLTP